MPTVICSGEARAGLNSVSEDRGEGGRKLCEHIGGSGGSRPCAHSRRCGCFEEESRRAGLGVRDRNERVARGKGTGRILGNGRDELEGDVTGLLQMGKHEPDDGLAACQSEAREQGDVGGTTGSGASACFKAAMAAAMGKAGRTSRAFRILSSMA